MDKDRVAAAPLRTEEDDNGDDKMAVEERTSAESKVLTSRKTTIPPGQYVRERVPVEDSVVNLHPLLTT